MVIDFTDKEQNIDVHLIIQFFLESDTIPKYNKKLLKKGELLNVCLDLTLIEDSMRTVEITNEKIKIQEDTLVLCLDTKIIGPDKKGNLLKHDTECCYFLGTCKSDKELMHLLSKMDEKKFMNNSYQDYEEPKILIDLNNIPKKILNSGRMLDKLSPFKDLVKNYFKGMI